MMFNKKSKRAKGQDSTKAEEQASGVEAGASAAADSGCESGAEAEAAEAVADTEAAAKTVEGGNCNEAVAGADGEGAVASEAEAFKERYVRLMADFDNYRKRQARDYEEMLKRSNERLLSDLLPVTDHLELALKSEVESESPFVAGVKLVYEQLVSLMARYHVTPIDAVGKEFDPHLHEALAQVPSESVDTNWVIEQYRRGWKLNDRLLRAAQVVVSSGAPAVETGSRAEVESQAEAEQE